MKLSWEGLDHFNYFIEVRGLNRDLNQNLEILKLLCFLFLHILGLLTQYIFIALCCQFSVFTHGIAPCLQEAPYTHCKHIIVHHRLWYSLFHSVCPLVNVDMAPVHCKFVIA